MAQASQQVVTPSQSNSTADYLTQLVQDRDDLVTNLTTKGITGLTGDETFTELVPEVLNIPSGSGHDWSAIGYSGEPQAIQDGYDYAVQIKNNWDNTQTNIRYKFKNDKNLLIMPLVDTSNATTQSGDVFENAYHLIEIPALNTSNFIEFNSMFQNCSALRKIAQLDLSSVQYLSSAFSNCVSLTDLGGFKDLGKGYLTTQSANYGNYKLNLSACTLLTHDSLMNVINNLYDIATKGCNTQGLILGSTNLAKLSSAEIAIATNKGWAVS